MVTACELADYLSLQWGVLKRLFREAGELALRAEHERGVTASGPLERLRCAAEEVAVGAARELSHTA